MAKKVRPNVVNLHMAKGRQVGGSRNLRRFFLYASKSNCGPYLMFTYLRGGWMHTTCTAVSAIIKEFPPLMPSHSLSKYPTIHWLDFVDGARDVKKMHQKLHDLQGESHL